MYVIIKTKKQKTSKFHRRKLSFFPVSDELINLVIISFRIETIFWKCSLKAIFINFCLFHKVLVLFRSWKATFIMEKKYSRLVSTKSQNILNQFFFFIAFIIGKYFLVPRDIFFPRLLVLIQFWLKYYKHSIGN